MLSTKAHAHIISIDWSSALAMEGVVDKVDHTDVPGKNIFGAIFQDELIFATDKVNTYYVCPTTIHKLAHSYYHSYNALNKILLDSKIRYLKLNITFRHMIGKVSMLCITNCVEILVSYFSFIKIL